LENIEKKILFKEAMMTLSLIACGFLLKENWGLSMLFLLAGNIYYGVLLQQATENKWLPWWHPKMIKQRFTTWRQKKQ
jgi:hypothetical protein